MAHMMKLKMGAGGAIVRHDSRDGLVAERRENVDAGRTHLNRSVRVDREPLDAVRASVMTHEKTAGKKIRSDANVAFSWVVTLPADVKERDESKFFQTVLDFTRQRYGKDNLVGAWLHNYETTPHLHALFTPMLEGKLQASKMVDRKDLQTFHKDLSAAVEHELGYKTSVELADDDPKKLLSDAKQQDLTALSDRLEYLRRSIEETRARIIELVKERLAQLREGTRDDGHRVIERDREADRWKTYTDDRERDSSVERDGDELFGEQEERLSRPRAVSLDQKAAEARRSAQRGKSQVQRPREWEQGR